jgi:hypothetical protein
MVSGSSAIKNKEAAMGTINSITTILIYGVLFSIPAILFERIFIYFGWTRGNTAWLVVGCFTVAILKQLIDSSGSFWVYCFFATIMGSVSMNRVDIINTIRKGKWWWKK